MKQVAVLAVRCESRCRRQMQQPVQRLHHGLVVGVIVTTAGVVLAQAPQEPVQTPTFRSSIDLVPVDVNIIDKTGRPVGDLEAGDFVLTVDGRPRRIASAQYIPTVRDEKVPPPEPAYYSSNAATAGGRLIMIVVDQGNIGQGRGKLAMDGIARFISKLSPADRVGLVAIPGAGPQLDFTANQALVRSLLPRLVGQASFDSTYHVGISEAASISRGDEQMLSEVIDRECAGLRESADIALCRRGVSEAATTIYTEMRARTRNSLIALRYLFERLALTPSPKTVVFVSESLVIDRDISELSWVEPAAAKGQIVLYVMELDPPLTDASARRISPTRSADDSLAQEGLNALAGMTRGSVFRVVSNPDGVLSRLALELSGYYLISFEPESGDRDGKAHKIKVDVPGRKNVEIRARNQFIVEPAHAKTNDETLAETIRAPLLANEIGLKVSTYTLRDPASPKLRVLVVAEIDRSLNPSGHAALAFTLFDSKGAVVGSQIERDLKAPGRNGPRTQTFVGSILTNGPGPHTLKLAVVDDAGKRGSVERTFNAQLTSAGQLRATDLLIAENTGAAGPAGVVPAVSADFTSSMLQGYLELYCDAPEVLKNASIVLEIAETEEGRALDAAAARLQQPSADAPNRRTAEAAVPIALLPPGDYVARAVINIDGRKAGQVARPFRIGRPAVANAATTAGKPAPNRTPIPFSSKIDAFDRKSVLTPGVVGFFLDRMNVGKAGATPAAPAIEHARNGRFDAAVDALRTAGNDQLSATFLTGLALLARGQLDPAADKFREALRLDSEFFPAAFYLGACYAAGGRDRQAVGAWQTSLVTESDAPFIYTLLGDALLRLRDLDEAVDILKEASNLWPDSDEVKMRLGTAYAMAGKPAEALEALQPYLQRHPEDQDGRFTVLRLLYEAKAAGRPVKSLEEDRALFTRYAAEYKAANGRQLPIVEQWKKFMER